MTHPIEERDLRWWIQMARYNRRAVGWGKSLLPLLVDDGWDDEKIVRWYFANQPFPLEDFE